MSQLQRKKYRTLQKIFCLNLSSAFFCSWRGKEHFCLPFFMKFVSHVYSPSRNLATSFVLYDRNLILTLKRVPMLLISAWLVSTEALPFRPKDLSNIRQREKERDKCRNRERVCVLWVEIKKRVSRPFAVQPMKSTERIVWELSLIETADSCSHLKRSDRPPFVLTVRFREFVLNDRLELRRSLSSRFFFFFMFLETFSTANYV